jgi:hypothetical protein
MTGCLFLQPDGACAQSATKVGLGLSFTRVAPTSDDATPSIGPGVLLRLRTERGVGPAVGLSWFSSTVGATIDGQATDLGRIDVRPVMVGVRCTRPVGTVYADVALEAGYAFTSVRGTGLATRAYTERLGARDVSVTVSNAFAWKGSLSVWHELGRRWGVMASVGYLGVGPAVTTTSSLGSDRRKVNLGSVVTSVGITYGVF